MISLVLSLSVNVFGFTTYYEDEEGNSIKIDDFIDTRGHWAHDQIYKWADYNIVQGSNGNFMPDNPIIRGDLAIIIDRMLGLKNTTYNYFSDLYSSDYYRESLLKCVAEGYINGIGDNKVNPRGNATREEVAVILCRVFKIDTSYSGGTGFKDDSNISSWARSSIYALSRLGYLNGTPDGKVNPKSNITRAEMITLLNNFADTYIPNRDIDSSGDTFVSNFPKNLVTSRNVELKNSTVGRDIYLTQRTSSLNLINTTVRGKIVCFDRVSLSLDNSSAQQIYLGNGKSTITGVSNLIEEVYVCEYASESTLDTFPNKLVLEPGVRVKVNDTMYENTTAKKKTYNGEDLRAVVSDEQGYIVGGPKISSGKSTLTYDNTLIIENIKVTMGDNEVREIGIIWLENDKDEEPINPTYKKNDGRKRYTGAYHEPFTFELEDVEDYCTYRLYVRDRDGLYAYSTPFTLEAYDFSITMDIKEENYPEKLKADVVFRGANVPTVRSVQVIYAENDLYSEEQETVSLRKYTEEYAEDPTDDTKYLRYTGTITSPSKYENGESVYTAPTAFGYIITFGDGKLINRFPVLSNVIPDGIDPVNTLVAGSATFGDKRIIINDSRVVTNLISVEEVGIAYRESSSPTMSKPSGTTSGWSRVSGGRNLDIKETYTFDVTIPITDTSLNTFYVPYVKTSNGYFYGEVNKVENNWLGDEGGPRITGAPIVTVLSDTDVLVMLPYKTYYDLDLNNDDLISKVMKDNSEVNDFLDKSLTDLNCSLDREKEQLTFHLTGLSKDNLYILQLSLKDSAGLNSNVVSIKINTEKSFNVIIKNKEKISENETKYEIAFQNADNIKLASGGHYYLDYPEEIVKCEVDQTSSFIYVDDKKESKVLLSCFYILEYDNTSKFYYFNKCVVLE